MKKLIMILALMSAALYAQFEAGSALTRIDTVTYKVSVQGAISTASTNLYSKPNTLSGGNTDSTTFGFTSISVVVTNDSYLTDTLFIAGSNTFPSTTTIAIVGGEFIYLPYATTKLYTRFGLVSHPANRAYRIWAN